MLKGKKRERALEKGKKDLWVEL